MHVDGLYRTLARWRRNHLDPLFRLGARQIDRRPSLPPSKMAGSNRAASPAANSFVLYGAVFVGGAVASFMLVLAILTPSGREAANRAPLVAAQLANERTVRRSRGFIFSRQSGSVLKPREEAPLLCFYDRYTERKKEPVRYQLLKHLPARFCSHLVYGFVSPSDLNNGSSGGSSQAGPMADADHRIRQMVQLKQLYPTLRVLVGVGGPKVDSKSFSDELITEGRREHFAQRGVRWLRARHLDGMHVQWMYPGEGNGRPSDRENFPKLLAQIRNAFRAESSRWHLTMYLPHEDDRVDRGFELRNALRSVHYAVMGSFGFVEPGRAEVSSPLYNRPPAGENRSPINSVHELVVLLLDRGAPRNKLLLAVSASGYSYALARADTDVRAPLRGGDGRGQAGPFSSTPGRLAYFEICYNVYRNSWARVFDAATSCPYAYRGQEWVTYDDADSVRAKVAFLRNQTLGGAALMDVAADDYMGMCGPRNVLARTLRSALKHYSPPVAQSPSSHRKNAATAQHQKHYPHIARQMFRHKRRFG
ncbi:chitinase-3-like protein 2 [Dermacentor albipictus]|uniref:chitinase-3-like protein 2 n=1 Tax=Dermacentor albipictus TaxID=60249 RepID=UPI0031FD9534